jgi:tetratricopeptide (TPR) repeat protein
LIEEVVGLAENLEPVALIGAGGIGKTSIALTVLHHDRIKKRFGDNRRFIRCDRFPASHLHLLSRLSEAIGADIQNPEDLTPLRPFLSSEEMILFLDNAESILDPQGPDAREIYALVEELSRFGNISLCITSRISTVPPHFKRPMIPTLSTESASDIFYSIYENGGRSDTISDLVGQLDFHALSITLLATTAFHNMWDYDRLAREWDTHRGQVLRTDYDESLAATMELSLASPTFRKLGPEARDLLGVVAFFPQGVDEDNLDWLFPTISDRKTIFDKFCVLSLTYRSNGFITMLAPIRDYLSPPDPKSSPLLCATKDHYFNRLSTVVDGMPGFGEARLIKSEDVNVEHLLNTFTSLDTESGVVWEACIGFLGGLYWYKPRYTLLGTKIEGLPDDHHSKPECLFHLSLLYQAVENHVEQKRLLSHSLELGRKRGSLLVVAHALSGLSDANRNLGLYAEGIQQAREAIGILQRLGEITEEADSWNDLARSLHSDNQLDAAEAAVIHAIGLLPEKGQEFRLCQSHQDLGEIYHSKGEREKAIDHFKIALGIASTFKWDRLLHLINHSLARLFAEERNWDDTNTYLERAKTHMSGDEPILCYTVVAQAAVWYQQGRLEDATSEALAALKISEELGELESARMSKDLLRIIEQAKTSELLEIIPLAMFVYPPQQALSPCTWSFRQILPPSTNLANLFPTFRVLFPSLLRFCGTFYLFYFFVLSNDLFHTLSTKCRWPNFLSYWLKVSPV